MPDHGASGSKRGRLRWEAIGRFNAVVWIEGVGDDVDWHTDPPWCGLWPLALRKATRYARRRGIALEEV